MEELIVETGEGIPGADSYNSIAELDAYMTKFGYADWPVTTQSAENPPDDEQGGLESETPEQNGNDEDEQQESGGDEIPDVEQPSGEIEESPAEDPILLRKQAAARRAAIYIDSTYGVRFTGVPTTSDQGLAWPRTGAVDFFGRDIPDDKIPIEIKRSHAEVTLLAFKNTPLAPDAAGGQILKRKKIDVLEWEWDVDSYGNPPIFGWVDKLLLPLLGPASEVGALDILGVQRA